MNFELTNLITAIIFSSIIGAMVWVSFFISRRFIDLEMEKLCLKPAGKFFDKIMILAAGVGLVSVILFFLLSSSFFSERLYVHLFVETSKSHFNFTYADFSKFCELTVILLGTLIVVYTALAPAHMKLRFFDIDDEAAKEIYGKYRKITIFSILFGICGLFAIGNAVFSYAVICFAVIYYTAEILKSRQLLDQSLEIVAPVEYSCAEKLISFINGKFAFVLLGGMYCVTVNGTFFAKTSVPDFAVLKNIASYIFSFYFFQLSMSRLANYAFLYINKIESNDEVDRRKDIIWICDISTIMIYFSVCCSLLSKTLFGVKFNVFQSELTTSIVIVLITMIIYLTFKEFIRSWKISGDERFKTFVPVLSISFNFALFFISCMMILFVFGIPISPILTVFATLDVAIAFAVKDTIKSFIQGVILLYEKDIFVGNYLSINGLAGTVEKISLRVIVLREESGRIHIIPYSQINTVTNYTTDYYVLVETLRVAESKDIEKAMTILREVIQEFKQDSHYKNIIISDLDIKGLDPFSLNGGGIGIEWRLRTNAAVPGIRLRYEIYRKIQEKFDEHGIMVPGVPLLKNIK